MRRTLVALLPTWGHVIGRIVCHACGNRVVIQVRLAKDGHTSALLVDVDPEFRQMRSRRPGRRTATWLAYDLEDLPYSTGTPMPEAWLAPGASRPDS